MSPPATRLHRPEAVSIARSFVDLIDDCCLRLVIAGSLRRRLAFIGDIEVVAIPAIERVVGGLFDDEGEDLDRLHARMCALLDNDQVEKRISVNGVSRWGPTLKYLTFRGASVDLFSSSAGRWGWILALRTGPAAFSRQLVLPQRDDNGRKLTTKDGRPGLLPPHLKPRDGWLTRRASGERVETIEERDVFALFGLAYQEPWERV